MGGYPNINLGSHKKDDRHYNRKRRELRKFLPALREYLNKKRFQGEENTPAYGLLTDLSRQLSDNSIRVPMHILLRGEDLLRRNVLRHLDPKSSIVEVVWRSESFRLAVAQKLQETVRLYGNTQEKSPTEMEDHIFTKARNKDEYLESAARIILHLRECNIRSRLKTKAVSLAQSTASNLSQESSQAELCTSS